MLAFLKQRDLPTENAGLTMSWERGQDGMVAKVAFDLRLPEGFPEKYERAIMRAVEQCSVKRHLHKPPEFEVAVSREVMA
jgi:uncharacterized OsmC-like protein